MPHPRPKSCLALPRPERLECRLRCWRGEAVLARNAAIAIGLVGLWPHPASSQSAPAKQEDMPMSQQVKAELAPSGVLRAGINLSNFLLVTGKTEAGEPADMADTGAWDIGLIGAEPQRAEKIAFTPAYVEIEATYLVPAGSPLQSIGDVDKPGVRIAVTGRSAYGLWLDRNIKQAQLVKSNTLDSAYEQFVADKLDALAGLRPRLLTDVEKLPGARILEGQFTAVQQAIGTARRNAASADYLRAFVAEAKASGFVGKLIEKHKVRGLSVAPPA